MLYIDAIMWEWVNHEQVEDIGDGAIQVSSFGHIFYETLLLCQRRLCVVFWIYGHMNLKLTGDIKTIAVNLVIIGTESISKSWGWMRLCHKRRKEPSCTLRPRKNTWAVAMVVRK